MEDKASPDTKEPGANGKNKVVNNVQLPIASFITILVLVATTVGGLAYGAATKGTLNSFVTFTQEERYHREANTSRIDTHEDWIMEFNTAQAKTSSVIETISRDISEIKDELKESRANH